MRPEQPLNGNNGPIRQTPAHDSVNSDLLRLVPAGVRHLVDVGCAHGAMARAVRAISPATTVTGIDIDPDYVEVARAHCNVAIAADIESMSATEFKRLADADCWVFGDCLEHLRDPWGLLRRVRQAIPADGCVLVCLPNAQHWSVQWRLATGNFRYEDSGLMDRTHIRWFTRTTMLEMFALTGWQVNVGLGRQVDSVQQQQALLAVRAYAQAVGFDPALAEQDARPIQYLFRLIPQTIH